MPRSRSHPDEDTFRRRRRRFVTALLALVAFALLTGSYVGAFGGTERGLAAVVSPIQEGASKVAKPFRDLVNWVGDTFRAKGDLASVTADRDRLSTENAILRERIASNVTAAQLAEIRAPFARFGPVDVSPIAQSSSAWYRTVTISKGTSDGVREDAPVLAPNGLVGKVISARPGSAVVRLITDRTSGVTAKVGGTTFYGSLRPARLGTPSDLVLEVPKSPTYRRGDPVVTNGSTSQRLESRFPAGIPIGRIARIDDQDTDAQVVHVTAAVDMRRLPETLTVLTAVPDPRP